MSSDGTSTPDEPRDGGSVEGSVEGDPDLAREVALARRLAAFGSALDPEPQARERARRRLLAALEHEAGGDGPSRAS